MIIRERADEFVMITQHDHAQISGECALHWSRDLFRDSSKRDAVELAIKEHDRGWINVDKKPLWNNETNAPFSFMNYPLKEKLALYKRGIDEVEMIDPYAALLCSEHYIRFTARNNDPKALSFVWNERKRQERLKERTEGFNGKSFQSHYHLLAFCDNLSLYICLNEPGITKEMEHRFFQKGIPIPDDLSFYASDRLQIHWKNEQTIVMAETPFKKTVNITLKQKRVDKRNIIECGIQLAYENTPLETVNFRIEGE